MPEELTNLPNLELSFVRGIPSFLIEPQQMNLVLGKNEMKEDSHKLRHFFRQ